MKAGIALTVALIGCFVSVHVDASGPCTLKMAEVDANPMPGRERPRCDEVTGDFLGMQYIGSMAVCVTTDGTSIPNYSVNRWEANAMDCQCARDQYEYQQTGLIGKMFHCEANGNYASKGCTGSVCYCQDQNGNQVGTSTVSIGEMDSLNC